MHTTMTVDTFIWLGRVTDLLHFLAQCSASVVSMIRLARAISILKMINVIFQSLKLIFHIMISIFKISISICELLPFAQKL